MESVLPPLCVFWGSNLGHQVKLESCLRAFIHWAIFLAQVFFFFFFICKMAGTFRSSEYGKVQRMWVTSWDCRSESWLDHSDSRAQIIWLETATTWCSNLQRIKMRLNALISSDRRVIYHPGEADRVSGCLKVSLHVCCHSSLRWASDIVSALVSITVVGKTTSVC